MTRNEIKEILLRGTTNFSGNDRPVLHYVPLNSDLKIFWPQRAGGLYRIK